MECTGCGKNLSADELRGENCPYCETALPHQKDAIAQAAAVKELLRDADGDGVPDVLEGTHLDPRTRKKPTEVLGPQSMPSQKKPVEYKKKSGGTSCLSIVFVLILLAGIGAVIYYQDEINGTAPEVEAEPTTVPHSSNISVHISPGSTTITTSSGGTSSGPAGTQNPKLTYFNDACLLDANGDGADDIAGLTSSKDGVVPAILVDGATGGILWRSEGYSNSPQLHCVSADWFVVEQSNFQLNFHSARNPKVPVRVLARDRLWSFGMGEGCVAYKTMDGTLAGVTLPAGTATRCKVKTMRKRSPVSEGIMTHKKRYGVKIAHGGRIYQLKARSRGTRMLTVTAKEKKNTLWSKELPYKKPSSKSAIAVVKDRVVVWGVPPSERGAYVIGLDAETGAQVYSHKATDSHSSIEIFEYNERALILHFGTTLQAHDITSGKLLWKIGR